MLKDIFISFSSYKLAHAYIRQNGLLKWIILSGLLYSGFFFLFASYFLESYNHSTSWLFDIMHLKQRLAYWENTVWQFLFIIGKVFFDILLLLTIFSFYKSVFLLFASPLFVLLSSKISHPDIHLNPTIHDSIKRDIWKGFWLNIKTGLWALVFMISLLIIAIIPFVGWFTPILFFVIDMYYVGTDMIGYALIGIGKKNKPSGILYDEHKGLAIGNGLLFYAMHLVPVIGWIFAPGYAVVAATLSLQKIQKQESSRLV